MQCHRQFNDPRRATGGCILHTPLLVFTLVFWLLIAQSWWTDLTGGNQNLFGEVCCCCCCWPLFFSLSLINARPTINRRTYSLFGHPPANSTFFVLSTSQLGETTWIKSSDTMWSEMRLKRTRNFPAVWDDQVWSDAQMLIGRGTFSSYFHSSWTRMNRWG